MIADPTGLRYDRADLDEEPTTATPPPEGRDGWSVTGRGPAALEGDASQADTPALARVIVLPPFNLRELAARHITAAELDRQQRGAA